MILTLIIYCIMYVLFIVLPLLHMKKIWNFGASYGALLSAVM